MLRRFYHTEQIEPDDIREMVARANCDFSVEAAVRVPAYDRAGLERLVRSYARLSPALERLELLDAEHATRPSDDGLLYSRPNKRQLMLNIRTKSERGPRVNCLR